MKRTAFLMALALATGGQVSFSAPAKDAEAAWHVPLSRPASILDAGRNPIFAGLHGSRFYFGCGLFRLDGRGRPRPDLARRATSREGGLVWDVILRPGLRLADGSALDAFAFVRLWTGQIPARGGTDWLMAPLAMPPVALDGQTVRFRLNAPRPEFRRRLSHPWLVLTDPHAVHGDRSSLGPFRLRHGTSPGNLQIHLVARSDHHHGLDLPGDLIFGQPVPGETASTYCAEDLLAAWLVFSERQGPPVEVRRRLAEMTELLRGGNNPPGTGGGARPAARELRLLLPGDDPQLAKVADQLQATLVDQGLRLRLERTRDGLPAGRLRAGLFSVALVPMPASIATAFDMEARLAAIGWWRSHAQARLSPWLSLPRRRQEGRPYLELMQPEGEAPLLLPVQKIRTCRSLPAGAPPAKLLPWLTPLPVRAFREQTARVLP